MKNCLSISTLIAVIRISVINAGNYYSTETVYPCDYKYDPVCGSDGLTYFNLCILEHVFKDNIYKGLEPILPDGNCKECICRNVDLPVCALDGTSYANECELDCINTNRIKRGLSIIYLAYRSKCLGPPCDCPTIASPVCGSDNILYRNKCVLKCASKNTIALGLPEIDFKNFGACQDDCSCPSTYQPVCGTNGKSYNNPCKLQCENRLLKYHRRYSVQVLYNGKCNECVCYDVYDPVCASDGTTYDNECRFNCENQKRYSAGEPLLKSLGKGRCVSCICEALDNPVCGTDNQTYSNDCVLQCQNWAIHQNGLSSVNIYYRGKCQDLSNAPQCSCYNCSNRYKPVCANDYASYWNYCWMSCYSVCYQQKGLPPLQLLNEGPCF